MDMFFIFFKKWICFSFFFKKWICFSIFFSRNGPVFQIYLFFKFAWQLTWYDIFPVKVSTGSVQSYKHYYGSLVRTKLLYEAG